jgi:hypothetical protein
MVTWCMLSHAKTKKNNEEEDVWVVTRGGEKIGAKFEHGEGSGKKLDQKIRKAPQPPPNFDVSQ